MNKVSSKRKSGRQSSSKGTKIATGKVSSKRKSGRQSSSKGTKIATGKVSSKRHPESKSNKGIWQKPIFWIVCIISFIIFLFCIYYLNLNL